MLTEATRHQNTLHVPFMLPLPALIELEVPRYKDDFISILLIALRSPETSRLNSKLVNCGFPVDWLDLAAANSLSSLIWPSSAELIVLDMANFVTNEGNLCQKLRAYLKMFKLPLVIMGSAEQTQWVTDQLHSAHPIYQLKLDGRVEAKIVQFITEINYLTRRYS